MHAVLNTKSSKEKAWWRKHINKWCYFLGDNDSLLLSMELVNQDKELEIVPSGPQWIYHKQDLYVQGNRKGI